MVGLNSIPYSCKIICDWICIHYLLFMMVVSFLDLPSMKIHFGFRMFDFGFILNFELRSPPRCLFQIPKSKFRNPKSTHHEAFFTPGILPANAISRNVTREMPNWRM